MLNAIGATVAEAVRLTGSVVTFELPPRTYALRAVAPDFKDGLLQPPVDLYGPVERQLISLRPLEEESTVSPTVVEPKPDPRIEVPPPDPLTVIEVRDETGDVKAVWRAASELPPVTPGFYRLRLVGPEASSEEQFVTLTPGETEKVEFACSPAAPSSPSWAGRSARRRARRDVRRRRPRADRLGRTGDVRHARGRRGDRRGSARGRRSEGLRALGVTLPAAPLDGGDRRRRRLRGRIRDGEVSTRSGTSGCGCGRRASPSTRTTGGRARRDPTGLGVHAVRVKPGPYWLSLERGEKEPPVISLTVLNGRLATLVAQVEPEGLRLYQYHPALEATRAPHRRRCGGSNTWSGRCSAATSTRRSRWQSRSQRQRRTILSPGVSAATCCSGWGCSTS